MKMKKSFIVMGLMLAASALTNCSKDDTAATDASDLRQGFTLRAEYTPIASDTRTTLDPATGKVAWDAEDELLVFCRETGTEPASWEQYKFTTTEEAAAQGIFTCPDIAIDPAKSYDWYIMSPYSSYVKNPLGESNSGTFQIGNQTQDNAAPTAHLTNADLMTGVITGVAGDRQPVVTLAHRATLMKFTIVNKETEAITPATVEFEAPSNVLVGGRFAVDFATGALTADTKWTSTTLTIENAPAIEPNGTYDIYMMMPPFTLASGDEFVITVTTDKGRSEQSRTMTREVKFEAGKMNSATINYEKEKPQTITGDWTTTLEHGVLGITGSDQEVYTTVILDKLFWNASYTWGNANKTYMGGSANDGAQIGSSSNYCQKAVFSTSYYGSPVNTITINAKGAKPINTAGNATISVTVNGMQYTTDANPITNQLKDFVFKAPAGNTAQTGEIVITIDNPTAKGALYVKEISISDN